MKIGNKKCCLQGKYNNKRMTIINFLSVASTMHDMKELVQRTDEWIIRNVFEFDRSKLLLTFLKKFKNIFVSNLSFKNIFESNFNF